MVIAGGCVALDAASGTLLRRLGDLFCANYSAGRTTAQLTEADTQMGDLLSNPIYDKTSAGDPCRFSKVIAPFMRKRWKSPSPVNLSVPPVTVIVPANAGVL